MVINKKTKLCDCGNILWEWINEDIVKILGTNGQDYEISFNYINLVCKKCGKHICVRSDIAETISDLFDRTSKTLRNLSIISLEERPYTLISNSDKKTILKDLSKVQKEIFSILVKGGWKIDQGEIANKIGLPKKIIIQNLKVIDKKIEEIKPNFKKAVLKISRK